MKISVNGETIEVAATSIAALLDELAYDGKVATALRSEERRVGKECRSRWSPYH